MGNFRIIFDEILECEQKMNDILCDHISRSCFCTKDKGYRLRWFFATLNLQIFADDVQSI